MKKPRFRQRKRGFAVQGAEGQGLLGLLLGPAIDVAVAVEVLADAVDRVALPVLPVVDLAVPVGVALLAGDLALLVVNPEVGLLVVVQVLFLL